MKGELDLLNFGIYSREIFRRETNQDSGESSDITRDSVITSRDRKSIRMLTGSVRQLT